MKTVNVSDFLGPIKQMNPEIDFDSSFHFYYDETNNIKKFLVLERDFNNSFDLSFVLAGLVIEKERNNVEELFSGIKLQKNIKEVKLQYLATGNLFDCLKSKKLNAFLKNLLHSDFLIHISSINLFYFSIVDIIDSAIANSSTFIRMVPSIAMSLKNDLFRVCKMEKKAVVTAFYSFGYPNIKQDDTQKFIYALFQIFEPYEKTAEFGESLTVIKELLTEAASQNSLPFLTDNEDHVLIGTLEHFYLRPIYTFSNSIHTFDKEDEIEGIFKEYRIVQGEKELKNFFFEDSTASKYLQASDVITGFTGKLLTFVNSKTFGEIQEYLLQMNELQIESLWNYFRIIDKSISKNAAFIHTIASTEERQKLGLISEHIDSNLNWSDLTV